MKMKTFKCEYCQITEKAKEDHVLCICGREMEIVRNNFITSKEFIDWIYSGLKFKCNITNSEYQYNMDNDLVLNLHDKKDVSIFDLGNHETYSKVRLPQKPEKIELPELPLKEHIIANNNILDVNGVHRTFIEIYKKLTQTIEYLKQEIK